MCPRLLQNQPPQLLKKMNNKNAEKFITLSAPEAAPTDEANHEKQIETTSDDALTALKAHLSNRLDAHKQ